MLSISATDTKKEYCTSCFKSLGVTTRNMIYRFLIENIESTVGGIVTYIGLTQPTISYHLNDMESHGLLKSRKLGKEVYYSINYHCPTHDCECVLKSINFENVYAKN